MTRDTVSGWEAHVRTVLNALIVMAVGWVYLQVQELTVEQARGAERLAAIEALLRRDNGETGRRVDRIEAVLPLHEDRLNKLEHNQTRLHPSGQ